MESKIEKYQLRQREISSEFAEVDAELQKGADEADRVATIAENSREILHDLDAQFKEKTKLTDTDVAFLFLAIGLQIARQYLQEHFTAKADRPDDKTAAENTHGYEKKHSDRSHRYYNPSLAEVLSNPVPFDALYGSPDFDLGLNGKSHRAKTLGHDPLLGWIFGTANIATSTVTTWNFKSYHVKTGQTKKGDSRDKISNRADTTQIFHHILDKLLGKEGSLGDIQSSTLVQRKITGPAIIAASLALEAKHLHSDIDSKCSLPLPIVSTIDPEFASKLADYGLDMANAVTAVKQAEYAILINSIIAMIHRLFCDTDDEMELKLYEVRTRKILTYSNLVATSSNLAVVAITGDMKKLDIGGFAVTVYRLITDKKFIRQVKEEFVFGQFQKMILGDDYEEYSSSNLLSD